MVDTSTSAKIIASMFACYGQGQDGVRIATYTSVLTDIPTDILSKVCRKMILQSKFLPSVAEIVEASRSLIGSMDESSRMKPWAEAWQEIEHQMHTAFIYEKPVFSTKEIAKAVKCYGWKDLCETPSKDFGIAKAQLRNMYDQVCARSKEESVNNYVLGECKLLDAVNVGNTMIQKGGKINESCTNFRTADKRP